MPSKSVLIALTSSNEAFYDDGAKTGLFWSEAVHPYHVFTKAGFKVDFVSETGSFAIDDHSILPGYISDEDLVEYNNKEAKIHKAFSEVFKVSDIKAENYSIFFAAGGHACLYDFPTSTGLQKVAEEIYAAGGIVAAVCHGPAILEDIKDTATGKLLIEGKKVTAFSDAGEEMLGLSPAISRNNLQLIEPFFKEHGATYVAPEPPLASTAVTDGRLVTGANPASATATAEHCLEAFKKL